MADGQFQQVSAACHRLLGYEPTVLVGTLLLALIHPAYSIFVRKKFLDAWAHSAPVEFESRFWDKDGHPGCPRISAAQGFDMVSALG